MRIAVLGTGAVGGYFGAKLAAAGHEVVFIARGKHLIAMQRNGLRVQSPAGDLHLETPLFSGSPREAGIVELVLFCVKSYDTTEAAAALAPMIGDNTLIVSLQNGIDNPEKIAALWGKKRTLAGVVYIGAQVTLPGVIVHSSGGRIIVGEVSQAGGPGDKACYALKRSLISSGIPCEISTAIEQVQWSKLLWNAPFCAISCLTRSTAKEIVDSEPLTQLALGCMIEVQAAARTRGVDLDTGLFDQTLDFSKGLGDFKPSMLQDLEAGKPLEYDALNGIVVKLLRQACQEAPINHTLFRLLSYLDSKLRQGGITLTLCDHHS